ncbi:MAG: TIGR04283 family arsenosugar biosynthesis glycosyltransferase [Acidiferrobacterales bacterium]
MATVVPKITAIVPALNEAGGIIQTLERLQSFRSAGHTVIVVDGGSTDDTVILSRPLVDKVITATRSRASQMNAGARFASGNILWFLHADCFPPIAADQLIINSLGNKDVAWGRFDVRLSGSGFPYRTVEFMMNLRSRVTGIATGDQGIFVTRNALTKVGGFPEIPLMEDIAISKRLRSNGRPICLRQKITTSSRRWEKRGAWRTILMMWRLRLAYALGAKPEKLARLYR